jgi:hypothetical protein
VAGVLSVYSLGTIHLKAAKRSATMTIDDLNITRQASYRDRIEGVWILSGRDIDGISIVKGRAAVTEICFSDHDLFFPMLVAIWW